MTKQEEIRKGIARVSQEEWYKYDYAIVWEQIAQAIINYLHSQGVKLSDGSPLVQ